MQIPVKRIVLELDGDAEPIRGRVLTSFQQVLPFTGWASLFAILTQLAETADSDGAQANATDQGPEGGGGA